MIHGDVGDEEKQNYFKNLDQHVTNCKVLMCTTAVTVGIDIGVHFGKIFVLSGEHSGEPSGEHSGEPRDERRHTRADPALTTNGGGKRRIEKQEASS